jgi:cytosine/adenosine deaminase-related metal-dependent hydrolase
LKTLIRGGTVIAYDGAKHTVIEEGQLAYEGNTIIYVGESFAEKADQTIDAHGMLVIPGFVNTHCHVTDTHFTRGWLEDVGPRDWIGLYKILPAVRASIAAEDELAAAECAFCELLLSGTTTVVELGYDFEMMEGGNILQTERIADIMGKIGIRGYVGPRYRAGHWFLSERNEVAYRWYDDRGRSRFEDCVRFARKYRHAHRGRIRTLLAPGQVDTCDPDMLRETRRVADETGIGIELHAGQSPKEFGEIKARYRKSTIQHMADTGLLGPDFIIGHGMYLSEDGKVELISPEEINLLKSSGTSIAHLPYVKARYGTAMQSFAKYLSCGINICLGTDTYPMDMIHEMRCASICCKIADGDPLSASAREIFHAATLAGAKALQREDLGKLAPGCRADIVLVDVNRPHAMPLKDPFKHLVFGASGADVDTVIVDGEIVVERRRVMKTDLSEALAKLKEAGKRVWARVDL